MNRQEILNTVAGKELDQLIASEIFKLELDKNYKINNLFKYKDNWYHSIFDYSESMNNAMLVVELLRKNGIYISIETSKSSYVVSAYSMEHLDILEKEVGDSLPLLICKIALLCNMYDFVTLEV